MPTPVHRLTSASVGAPPPVASGRQRWPTLTPGSRPSKKRATSSRERNRTGVPAEV